MTQTMLQMVLATADGHDGPESWIHLCITAAEEARQAVNPPPRLNEQNRHDIRVMLGQVEKERGTIDSARLSMRERIALERALNEGGKVEEEDARQAAATAFRVNLPSITNRRSVQCFVACVAAGVLRGYIATKDANQLIYVAQVALSAFPKRKPSAGRKAKP